MYRLLATTSLFAAALAAQMGPGPGPGAGASVPANLRDYLGLNAQQVDAIARANLEHARFVASKQLRAVQVQREIAEETRRQTLDPMALGVRYLELEAIRREVREHEAITRRTALGALTDVQKARLAALEEAIKLQPVIAAAQCANLLAPPAAQLVSGVPAMGMGAIIREPFPGNIIPASRVIAPGCGAVWFNTNEFLPPPVQP